MTRSLIIYSTHYGFSKKVAEFIETILEKNHQKVDICKAEEVEIHDLFKYQHKYIIAPIRYGKYSSKMTHILNHFSHLFSLKDTSIISIDLASRKREVNTIENNPQLAKIWKRIGWIPSNIFIMPGELNYSKYNWIETKMMQLLMCIMKGPRSLDTNEIYTDWDKLNTFIEKTVLIEKQV